MAKRQEDKTEGGQHKASYGRDSETGAWIIWVVGPHAHRFIGRTVPVRTSDGEFHDETLVKLINTGDFDENNKQDPGAHWARYTFQQRKRERKLDDEIPF